MIPVHQTILADPVRGDGQPGNCYQAAIASVLELPLDEVPHFATFCDDWVERSQDWFASRGLVRSFYDGDARLALRYPLRVEPGTGFWGTPGAFRGAVSGAFLTGYGAFRFLAEYFRTPDAGIFGQSDIVSMGQWLSLPMLLTGLGLLVWSHRQDT